MKSNFQTTSIANVSDYKQEMQHRELLISPSSTEKGNVVSYKDSLQVITILFLISTVGGLLIGSLFYSLFFEFAYSLKLGLIHGCLCATALILNWYIRK